MSDTPLSDAMSEHVDNGTPETYQRFLELFRTSMVGIVAVGDIDLDPGGRLATGAAVGAGRTTFHDGQPRLLAFADGETAVRTFGAPCNADIPGEVLLRMAVDDDESVGILVNSGTREVSIVIDSATAGQLLGDA